MLPQPSRLFLLPAMLCMALTLLTLTQCAQPGALTGGPRDTTPPIIDSSASTPNFQTNFKKQPIVFTFDEFIELRDQFSQVVISPPLEYQVEISAPRKVLTFTFNDKEVLKENATYTVNFGESIVDRTEGNKLPLRFVFSTGPVIDSLVVRGRVVDALTGDPGKDFIVMLYDSNSDSIVYKEKPLYFAKADDTGNFKIENVRPGFFKGFALKDGNLNYTFDASEPFGFPDTQLMAGDTSRSGLLIRTSTTKPKFKVVDKVLKSSGTAKLGFSTAKDSSVQILLSEAAPSVQTESYPDSIRWWFDPNVTTAFQAFIRVDTLVDTLTIQPTGPPTKLLAVNFAKASGGSKRSTSAPTNLIPNEAPILTFNQPIRLLDSSKMVLTLKGDSSRVILPKDTFSVEVDSLGRSLQLNAKLGQDKQYEWMLLPGAIQGHYGLMNDTLRTNLKVLKSEDLGNITLKLKSLDAEKAYFVELLQNKSPVLTFTVTGATEYTYKTKTLAAGSYELRVTEDSNRNGVWDTGDYPLKRQPEKVAIFKLEPLRAGWELESEVDVIIR